MQLKNNGLFQFDYQLPIYNFFFPNQGVNVTHTGLDTVLNSSNKNITSRALYFHVPFCETICTFCPFTRGAYKDEELVNEYVKALIKEVEIKAGYVNYKEVPVRAIFFGGGTPSLLSADNIRQIGKIIHQHFNIATDCEFSFEIEVKSLTEEKVLAMKEIGVTHPRFGLQTFNPTWRKLFNLTSTYEQIDYAARLLNENFKTVTFDILYGMNGEDEEDLIHDLEKAINLGTTNIDIYPIDNVMTQSKLHKAIKEQGSSVTSATRKFTMNLLIDTYMRSKGFMPHNGHGYVRLEHITNDIVSDKYSFVYHKHVYGYSDHDLHGFGVNAVSSIRQHVISNTSSRNKYIKSILNEDVIPTSISTHPSILDEMRPIILRLAYHGEIDKNKVKMSLIPFDLRNKLEQLKLHKLIVEDDQSFKLTKLGWYWYTNIMFWLMPQLEQNYMKQFIVKELSTPGKFISKKELVYA